MSTAGRRPTPQLLQVRRSNRIVGIRQPGRRPGQDEPGQHIRLERRQLIRQAGERISRRSRTTARLTRVSSPSLIQQDQHWRR